MGDVSPELADKVMSADLRNLIKKVGDGGTLSGQERQIFMEFAASAGDPDDLHRTRVTSLLRKWLGGTRLSKEELDEIAHVLPRKQQGESDWDGSPEEAAQRIGLTRRPFFRWLAFGRKHSDPLPCRDPAAVPGWYERMRNRGEFKHRCPDSVLAACGQATRALVKAVVAPGAASVPQASAAAPGPGRVESLTHRTLMFQLEDLERHIEQMRLDTERADEVDERRRLVKGRMELLDKASLIRARLIEQDKEEGRLMDPAFFREDMSSIIPPLIQGWQNEGGRAQREFKSQLPRHEFLALWKSFVLDFCRGLARSRFAPPLQLTET